ncbi:fasciclin domain-containing protein [Pedobacter panaciterrae]|jgi:Secreted and surface protein containing fasciclin-like repeats|uniref:Fasciclin domain-containing protein n=1 Tax=Pedobacter panaciterrae TaxID=363849 RepID=A0ABU8NHP4_9SPHI|nr:fasciclin domain-containing protein [Pedobacter panaciterrae]NQX53788.1 fasciclin domain-containing protein [Pedobacter panaciterrae]
MKIKLSYILTLVAFCVAFTACKKNDYIIGGDLHDPHVNMTTYDFLKTKPLFDTLVVLIDKAGLKDEINGNNTFFAPTDYSIKALLARRTLIIQQKYQDENIKYTLDSLPVPELRDSLRSHLFTGKINREQLSLENKVFKSLSGEDFSILLKQVDSYTGLVTTRPQYLYLTKIRNGLDPNPIPDDYLDEDRDIIELVQTSGILTTNGVLHVLNNTHKFYW